MLLVIVNGFGFCHARIECEPAATETACEQSSDEHCDEVADASSTSCGGHTMPSGKTLVSLPVSLNLPAMLSLPPAGHLQGVPDLPDADPTQRFASRSLPLLI